MTPPKPGAQIPPASADSVRAAIAAGNYSRALELWNEYVASLKSDGLNAATLAGVAELVNWSRPLLLATREHAAARLRALHVAEVYGRTAGHRAAQISWTRR